jgi:hypothetical protein
MKPVAGQITFEKKNAYKIVVIVGIQLILAAIHIFRLGQLFDGTLYNLYYGYASDIMLPFGAYFLLGINEFSIPLLRSWWSKALIVFTAPTACEIAQYFGIYAFGVTFDPLDILMYGVGVMLAAALDMQVFPRIFKFWKK